MVGVFVMAVEEVQVVSQFHTSVNRTPSLPAGTEITQWKNLYSEIGSKATKLSWFRRIAVVQDHLEGVNFPSGQVLWKCNWAHKLRFTCMRSYIIHVYCWHGLACIRIVQVKCTFSTSITGLPCCMMSEHYFLQQGRSRYTCLLQALHSLHVELLEERHASEPPFEHVAPYPTPTNNPPVSRGTHVHFLEGTR